MPSSLAWRGRSLAGALVLVGLACVAASADVARQDWIPEAVSLPDDAEVVTDRAIGSSVRIFSFRTSAEVGPLLAEWEAALQDAGYAIERGRSELVDGAIEFRGEGIANAKIVATRGAEGGHTVMEFDATLE
jgi:hypothetical protein